VTEAAVEHACKQHNHHHGSHSQPLHRVRLHADGLQLLVWTGSEDFGPSTQEASVFACEPLWLDCEEEYILFIYSPSAGQVERRVQVSAA
jgi:hypothetical protein